MKNLIVLIGLLLLTACGGGDDTTSTGQTGGCSPGLTQACVGPGACSGGQSCSADGVWGECVCGAAGSGGTGSGGTAGSGGGIITPPGGSGGVSGTGGAGTGGGTTCVSKTCLEVAAELTLGQLSKNGDEMSAAKACSWASDGCGNLIDCGSCPTSGTTGVGCGETAATAIPATPNICGSRCILTGNTCSGGSKNIWLCPSDIPPLGLDGCLPDAAANSWCCN